MQNPIIRNRRRKEINRLVKKYVLFLMLSFVVLIVYYKSGSVGAGRRPTYYKPTPNSWQFVFNHLTEIVCFSFCGAAFYTLVSECIQDD